MNIRLIVPSRRRASVELVKPIEFFASDSARVRCHDDDDVAEVCLAPVVVGQCPVVHHLQQNMKMSGCAFAIS